MKKIARGLVMVASTVLLLASTMASAQSTPQDSGGSGSTERIYLARNDLNFTPRSFSSMTQDTTPEPKSYTLLLMGLGLLGAGLIGKKSQRKI